MLRSITILVGIFIITLGNAVAEGAGGAQWELKVLGIGDEQKLAEVRKLADRRLITLAVVGLDGISRSRLESRLDGLARFRYCLAPDYPDCDPRTNTHDTGAVGVILDLTRALGIRVKLLSYQSEPPYAQVAEAFAKAARRADIVVTFHSFWGDVAPIVDSLRQAEDTLFISPYVQVGDRPFRDGSAPGAQGPGPAAGAAQPGRAGG